MGIDKDFVEKLINAANIWSEQAEEIFKLKGKDSPIAHRFAGMAQASFKIAERMVEEYKIEDAKQLIQDYLMNQAKIMSEGE